MLFMCASVTVQDDTVVIVLIPRSPVPGGLVKTYPPHNPARNSRALHVGGTWEERCFPNYLFALFLCNFMLVVPIQA